MYKIKGMLPSKINIIEKRLTKKLEKENEQKDQT